MKYLVTLNTGEQSVVESDLSFSLFKATQSLTADVQVLPVTEVAPAEEPAKPRKKREPTA